MLRYPVRKTFICKITKEKYDPGSVYETDEQRGTFLQKKGHLGPAIAEPQTPPEEPKHIGGGYYEMPDGSRVKGKEAALKAWDEQ